MLGCGLSGDWGFLISQSPETAAALEAASEDADISVSGHLVRIQSLATASLMYSSSQRQQQLGSTLPCWKPGAACAVYPDDYPPRPCAILPDDYLSEDAEAVSATGELQS